MSTRLLPVVTCLAVAIIVAASLFVVWVSLPDFTPPALPRVSSY